MDLFWKGLVEPVEPVEPVASGKRILDFGFWIIISPVAPGVPLLPLPQLSLLFEK